MELLFDLFNFVRSPNQKKKKKKRLCQSGGCVYAGASGKMGVVLPRGACFPQRRLTLMRKQVQQYNASSWFD